MINDGDVWWRSIMITYGLGSGSVCTNRSGGANFRIRVRIAALDLEEEGAFTFVHVTALVSALDVVRCRNRWAAGFRFICVRWVRKTRSPTTYAPAKTRKCRRTTRVIITYAFTSTTSDDNALFFFFHSPHLRDSDWCVIRVRERWQWKLALAVLAQPNRKNVWPTTGLLRRLHRSQTFCR